MLTLPWQMVLLRLGVATVLGAVIGLERERLDRAAGLRTHTLVALASSLLMIVSAYSFSDVYDGPRDPTRIAAQVVSGIGFLGAGVIIFRKNTVRGLTTAASIWTVAGIGLAAGAGLFVAAGFATAFLLIVQAGLRPLEMRFFVRRQEHRLVLRVRRGARRLVAVERAVSAGGVQLHGLRLRPSRDGAEDRVDLDLGAAREGAITTLLESLRELDGVRVVTYSRGAARPLPGAGADEADEPEGSEELLPDDEAAGEGRRY